MLIFLPFIEKNKKVKKEEYPFSIILSWYEQKAVADLLALLSLAVKNIYLGPSLLAFLSPNVVQYLLDTFDIKPISTAEEDLKSCLKQEI